LKRKLHTFLPLHALLGFWTGLFVGTALPTLRIGPTGLGWGAGGPAEIKTIRAFWLTFNCRRLDVVTSGPPLRLSAPSSGFFFCIRGGKAGPQHRIRKTLSHFWEYPFQYKNFIAEVGNSFTNEFRQRVTRARGGGAQARGPRVGGGSPVRVPWTILLLLHFGPFWGASWALHPPAYFFLPFTSPFVEFDGRAGIAQPVYL